VRLSRAEVDSQGAELRGARGLRCAGIDVAAPSDLEIDETRRDDCCLELCIQQSAGDSTLPEIDVLLALLRYSFLDHDVADLKTTVWLQNTRHFLESGKLVGKEVEHAVRDDEVIQRAPAETLRWAALRPSRLRVLFRPSLASCPGR